MGSSEWQFKSRFEPELPVPHVTPRKVATGFLPVIAVDRNSSTPLHRQIYDIYRAAIVNGNLAPEQKVPSSRALAAELRISRIPVLSAYAQLLGEGYLESVEGGGTFVSKSLPDRFPSSQHRREETPKVHSGPRPISSRSATLPSFIGAPWLVGRGAFTVGQVAVEHFPFHVWLRLVSRYYKSVRAAPLYFSDPMGSKDFRSSIAKYLRTVRSVKCDADQIMVVSGSQQALDVAARVLLDPGDSVWLEEPGYSLSRRVFMLAGCRLIPVPVDQEGLSVAAGIRLCKNARAAYVTPSHQFPLGATMSSSRRHQLLEWAQQVGAWIIEDDYDSEYRYESSPIASLQGLDRNSRVIYVGTFSKTLYPSLRVGYVVIPTDLVDRFAATRLAMDVYPSDLFQAVLSDFINEGHYSRHLRRTSLLYRERREALVNAIAEQFGSAVQVQGEQSGLHLVATLPEGLDDQQVAKRAAAKNVWAWPLSTCYLGRPVLQGLVLGFGSTPLAEVGPAIRRLNKAIDELR